MPFKAKWDDISQSILRYDISGRWNWTEFDLAFQQSLIWIKQTPYRVDIIADFAHSTSIPDNMLTKMRESLQLFPDNVGYVIFANGDRLINSLSSLFAQSYRQQGSRLMTASSLDDARAIIYLKRTHNEMPLTPRRMMA